MKGSGIEVYQLAPRLHLVQAQCYLAAYQEAFNYVLLDRRSVPARSTLIPFPVHDGTTWTLDTWIAGIPTFAAERGELVVFTKARGIGDCGQLARYGFPNGEPTLLSMRVRECRDEDDLPDAAFEPQTWPLISLDSVPPIPRQPGR